MPIETTLEVLAHLYKDPKSTTLERLRLTRAAHEMVAGLPQPLQLGLGLGYLLDRIDVPVEPTDLLVGRIREEVPDEEGEAFFQATIARWNHRGLPPWMRDGGHECLAWDRLLQYGLPGLEALARTGLARRSASGDSNEQLDFLRGAIQVYEAFRRYARRYADAAWSAGLPGTASNCAAVAERAPESFAEALQLIWLVGHVYCTMLASNPTLTFGRMDQLLSPYYQRDLEAGTITRDMAGAMIADFYARNNLILGRGEHQMSGNWEGSTGWCRNLTYDAPQYVVLGGGRQTDEPDFDDLTELFLERVDPRYENPVIVFRYHRGLPDRLWALATEKMRDNSSFMVYSDERVIPAMINCGIASEEAITYTMHGCNWPDIPGTQHQIASHQAVLPQYVLDAFDVMDDGFSMDDLYAELTSRFRADLETRCELHRELLAGWQHEGPGLLRVDDCFYNGPIENGRSWEKGGVRYPTITFSIAGLATAADSLAAIDTLIGSGDVSAGALRQALGADFEGHEALRQRCLRAPKFGQDDERADRHAIRLLGIVHSQTDGAARIGTPEQVIVFRCLETDMGHIGIGKRTGATPDGRRAGQPISENTSPYPGSCKNGMTAQLSSVAKLPLDRINSGALNVRVAPRLVAGDDGLDRLKALLRAYFDMGGLQIQLSVVDVETLRAAQADPDSYRDLMVRITGYSAAFVDMSPTAQEEIIRREEMDA